MNGGYTPAEARQIAIRAVDRLVEEGACTTCSIKVISSRYGLTQDRLLQLYLGDEDGEEV